MLLADAMILLSQIQSFFELAFDWLRPRARSTRTARAEEGVYRDVAGIQDPETELLTVLRFEGDFRSEYVTCNLDR